EVLHLDMETATYNSLKDVSCAGTTNSTNGQTVIMGGASTWVAGIDGGARNFNSGGTDYLQVSSLSSAPTSGITMAAWVYPTAYGTRILELGTGTWPYTGGALLEIDSSGIVWFSRNSTAKVQS